LSLNNHLNGVTSPKSIEQTNLSTTINRNKQMRTNISKKIRLLALLSLPFIITTSAFAQSLPTISVNPNPIDIGDVPVGNTPIAPGFLDKDRSVEVEVTNTSQEELRFILFTSSPQRFGTPSRAIPDAGDAVPDGGLKPGGKARIRISCNPLVVGDLVSGNIDILATTKTNPQLRKIATIPAKCKGIASQLSPRFSLQLNGAGINDVVNIQVKRGSGEIVKQLKCNGTSGLKSPASSCDLQVLRGFEIEVKSSSPKLTRFINATGSAKCVGQVCKFSLLEDSTVTAIFKQPSLPPSLNK
jgi:hypothetical protein